MSNTKSCSGISAIFKKEFLSFFITPVAYIYIAVFLLLSGVFTFYLGNFFERSSADLESFFIWHPWLYLFFLPALSMKLWSDEMRLGTIEIIRTLPISVWNIVLGKFLAVLAFAVIALLLTFPIWITVNILGSADNGTIIAGYLGSILMASCYLAIGGAVSAMTQNNVVAFIISVFICFLFTISGTPIVVNLFQGWMPQDFIDFLANFSFVSNFVDMYKGVISIVGLLYFTVLTMLWLFINVIIVKNYGN
jgi:ABC-2 type transport system permease protein